MDFSLADLPARRAGTNTENIIESIKNMVLQFRFSMVEKLLICADNLFILNYIENNYIIQVNT